MSSRQLQRTRENPNLELKIISANDVSYFDAADKMDVYAVVSIKGDNTQKKQTAKTPIDYDGGSNPTWNHTVKFSVDEKTAREGLLTVHVKLFSYWLEDEEDLYLGEVSVSLRELLASDPLPSFANGNVNKMKLVTYPLKSIGETKQNSKLSLSYRFKPVPVNNDLYPPNEPDYLPQPVYTNPDPAITGQPIIYSPQFHTTGQTVTGRKLAIELVIKSAREIKNVNVFDDMDVYASVMICEGETTTKHKTKTPIAYSGFIFPTWNHAVKFSLDEEEFVQNDQLSLVVELMSHRPLMGDKHIGKVNVRIQELVGLNPPSPLTNCNVNKMRLMTHKVRGLYGEKGTLSFTYRFLEEKVTVPFVPNTTPQPCIMYIPIPHQSYGSPDPVHGTSGYMSIQPGANVGPSNGLVPIFMPPPYQPHGYQQYSQLQAQEHLTQAQGARPQPQLQSPRPHQPTVSQVQTQGGRPQVKPQGGSIAAIGLGAAALGRVIGGALLSDIITDEVNL